MTDLLPPAVLELIVQTSKWTSNLTRATAKLVAFRDEMAKTITAMGEFSETIDTSAVEAANALAEANAKITASAAEASAAMRELGASAKVSASEQDAAAAASATGAEKTAASADASKAASGGMGIMGNKAVLAGLALAGLGAEAVKMAANYDSVTTRLVTSAGEQESALEMVKKGMLDMAGQVGVSAQNLAQAMYYVESAGYHAADGLNVLKAAAQGAKAEGADTTQVAKALTDVLVDYHLPASAAADVTSQMITAIAHGKTSLQDFSGAFASIIPAASAAGISFADAGSALAEMTNHGFAASRAAQNLAQALRSLLNPTKPMLKAFGEFGVSTDTLKKKLAGPNGLTDAMQYLSTAATKAGKEGTPAFAAALKLLMGTAPGANAALATTGENFDATTATIKAMSKASADAQGNVKGFAEVQGTLNQKMAEAKAAGQSLMITLGNALMPMFKALLTVVASVANGVSKFISVFANSTPLKTVAIAIVAIVTALKLWTMASKLATAAMVIFDGVMDANPIMLIVLAIAALVGAFIYLWNKSAAFREFWIDLWNGVKRVVSTVASWFNNNVIQPIVRYFHSLWVLIKPALDEMVNVIRQAWPVITKIFHAAAEVIKSIVHQLFDVIWNGDIKPTLEVMVTVIKTSWDIIGTIFKMAFNVIRDTIGEISGVIRGIVEVVSGVIRLISALFTGNWQAAWNAAKDIVDGVVTVIKSIGSGIYNVGRDIINGLIRGIKDMAGAVWSTVKDIGSGILNGFKSFLGISSPSRLMAQEVGQHITSGIAAGMANNLGAIHGAMGTIQDALTGTALSRGSGSLGAYAGLSTGGAGGGSVLVIQNNIAGTVVGETQLSEIMRTQVLRYNQRNPTNGLSLFGRGNS